MNNAGLAAKRELATVFSLFCMGESLKKQLYVRCD